jgi:glutathione S-transferase
MTSCKLTYFDFDGGRGEPIRIALHAGGIAFEDIRWSFPEFREKRQALRFQAVPVMEIDGELVTQSNALCRYVGRMAGLYPEDPLQALYCDEVLGALEDLNHHVVQTFGLEGVELRKAREALVSGRLTVFLKGFDELLTRGGGQYFANQCLTVADLKMFVQLRALRSGVLDHVPVDLVDQLAPALADFQTRIEQEPQVLAYYASIKRENS